MKSPKNPSNSHPILFFFRRLSPFHTYLTILFTVIGLLFSWSQLRLAQTQTELALRGEPLGYELSFTPSGYNYAISREGETLSVPAASLRLQVTHGNLHAATVISCDGSSFCELYRLQNPVEWRSSLVEIDLEPKAVLADTEEIYDYFFLYLEPVSGAPRLDLVYTVIGLDEAQSQPTILYPVSLLQLDYLPEGPRREMLSTYQALWSRMQELGLLTA